MTSSEYVDSIRQIMQLQDTHFNWFIGIISVIIALAVAFQWKFSNEQIEALENKLEALIKEKNEISKKEYKEELNKLEKIHNKEITNLKEENKIIIAKHKEEINKLEEKYEQETIYLRKNIDQLSEKIYTIASKSQYHSSLSLKRRLIDMRSEPNTSILDFLHLLHQYEDVLEKELGLFNMYINDLEDFLTNNKYDVLENNQEISNFNKILARLKNIEKNFENSTKSKLDKLDKFY